MIKKKNKKKLIAIIILVLVINVVGSTIAYFTSNVEFTNIFNLGTYKIVTTEEFTSPTNWAPGQSIKKTIVSKNEGTIPAAVRASITEQWLDEENNDITNQVESGTAIINLANTNNWQKEGNYYYYKYPLKPGEATTTFIKSVTLNPELNGVTCTTSADGKTKSCEATSNILGATYKLIITKETVQYDKYDTVWNTNVVIEGEPVIEETSEDTIFEFNKDTHTISGFKSEIHPTPTDIVIPDKIDNVNVEIIDEGAFYGKGLTSVRLPSTLKTIRAGAFSGTDPNNPSEGISNNLTEIKIPEGVTTIENAAFQYNSLETVILPTTLSELESYVFYNNPTLVSAYLPEGITSIGEAAFENCDLHEVEIPSTVTTIGNNALYKGTLNQTNSNMNLTKIVNKTNKSFNWKTIVNSTESAEFKTGTIKNTYGNVIVTDN